MIRRKEIPGIELPEHVEWRNPVTFSPSEQLRILNLGLKEPFVYKSDFSCLGGWKTFCGKEGLTKNCILRGFCHFWQSHCQDFSYSSLLMHCTGPDRFSYCKEIWRRNIDEVWKYFVEDFLLWKWAVLFYDCEFDDKKLELENQLKILFQKEDVGLLLNLEKVVGRLREGDLIKVNLGRRNSWEDEKKPLYLTIEKDFVFGIAEADEETGIGRQLRDHDAIMFLLALKWFKFRVKED